MNLSPFWCAKCDGWIAPAFVQNLGFVDSVGMYAVRLHHHGETVDFAATDDEWDELPERIWAFRNSVNQLEPTANACRTHPVFEGER